MKSVESAGPRVLRMWYTSSLLIIPLLCASATPIEVGRRLISGSNLNLHEESSIMTAVRTFRRCSIDILPSVSTTQDIINLLSLYFGVTRIFFLYIVTVWACRTAESHPDVSLLYQQ